MKIFNFVFRPFIFGLVGLALTQSVFAQNADVLAFKHFYKLPVGSHGLEISDVLRSANGKERKIIGYMVKQEQPHLGRFLLSPRPVQMSEHADGEADDLPAALVTVYLDASQSDWAVPYTKGLISLTGIIEVGRLEETDGRVSWVRMRVSPEATRGMNPFELAQYFHSLQHKH
ncbi:MAG: hypothetical protein WCO71_13025 [Pseudomonadota bacterium]